MNPTEDPAPKRFVFLLAPKLSMIALASAVDPLRLANRMSGREVYTWTFVSETADAVACSNGARIEVDSGLSDLHLSLIHI